MPQSQERHAAPRRIPSVQHAASLVSAPATAGVGVVQASSQIRWRSYDISQTCACRPVCSRPRTVVGERPGRRAGRRRRWRPTRVPFRATAGAVSPAVRAAAHATPFPRSHVRRAAGVRARQAPPGAPAAASVRARGHLGTADHRVSCLPAPRARRALGPGRPRLRACPVAGGAARPSAATCPASPFHLRPGSSAPAARRALAAGPASFDLRTLGKLTAGPRSARLGHLLDLRRPAPPWSLACCRPGPRTSRRRTWRTSPALTSAPSTGAATPPCRRRTCCAGPDRSPNRRSVSPAAPGPRRLPA